MGFELANHSCEMDSLLPRPLLFEQGFEIVEDFRHLQNGSKLANPMPDAVEVQVSMQIQNSNHIECIFGPHCDCFHNDKVRGHGYKHTKIHDVTLNGSVENFRFKRHGAE